MTESQQPQPAILPIGGAYVGDSFEIMALFEPDGGRIDEITTSLRRLARTSTGQSTTPARLPSCS
ncbi:hypothetical protein KV557_39660 [Kitasatospora aureofaciens]|uniref:hypothetical protein n=1 Tax=Kitasatospora aureofaciens TaxID=1894 RepID=UPI001C48A81E|nr:hypothetical protein [Kitasatospora aureofaciens]MBV6703145.1 hypothetical protein [Kitasatospora aureofaciens]